METIYIIAFISLLLIRVFHFILDSNNVSFHFTTQKKVFNAFISLVFITLSFNIFYIVFFSAATFDKTLFSFNVLSFALTAAHLVLNFINSRNKLVNLLVSELITGFMFLLWWRIFL